MSTLSILDLLAQINAELGVTIIMITHELEAAKRICSKVAVLEDGLITECGNTRDIFLDPKSSTGRIFLEVYKEFRDESQFTGGGGI